MSDARNPYAAPNTPVLASEAVRGEVSDAEAIRQTYLKHEASVKSIGLLYYLGGTLGTILGCVYMVGSIVETVLGGEVDPALIVLLVIGVVMFLISVGMLFTAYGLRRLRPWVRVPVAILAGIGLLGVPIGTLINGYILWLVLGQKGQMVLSPGYQQVIAQTPHIRYRTSRLVIVLLVILLVLLGLGIVGGVMSMFG